MAAFFSIVPTGDFVSARPVRPDLRLIQGGVRPIKAHPVAQWRRADDGRLVCRWLPPADPDPLP
jgi:hypothetical protein